MSTSSPHLGLEDLFAVVNNATVADRLRGHLATCRECRTEADQWSSAAAGVRHLTRISALPPLTLPSRRRVRWSPRRALAIAAAVMALAIGSAAYGLTSGEETASRPVTAIGLSAVHGCPGLAAALGIVERADPTELVIRIPHGQPVMVTLPTSAQVSRETAGSVGDLTDGKRAFVRGIYAGGRVVAHSITIGVGRRLPAPAIGWRTPSRKRPWIGAGTVRAVSGNTFVLVVPGGRALAVARPASAAIYSLARAKPSQIRTGDYVVAVGKPGPNGSLIATTIEAGTALPHNRGTGIAGLPSVGCKPSTIAAAAFAAAG